MSIDFSTISSVLDVTVLVIGALAAGWYAFYGAKKNQQAQGDSVAQNLISNLQSTVNILTAKLDQTTKELHQMQGRNTVLETLFNGSEGSIVAFLKQAPELMTMAKQTNETSAKTATSLNRLADEISVLVLSITPKTPKPRAAKTPARRRR